MIKFYSQTFKDRQLEHGRRIRDGDIIAKYRHSI